MSIKRKGNLKRIAEDQGAMISAKGILMVILTITLAFIFLGYVFPIALVEFGGVNTTNWTSGTTDIFNLLPIFGILAILGALVGILIKEVS